LTTSGIPDIPLSIPFNLQIMARHLTAKQLHILEVLKKFVEENDEAPTLSELQEILNIKTKRGVAKHLEALDKKGYIYRTGVPRGIKILSGNNSHTLGIPILGYANAGYPLVIAEEEIIGSIQVDKDMLKKTGDIFALIVKGDSMNMRTINTIPIENNNYVLVDKSGNYSDGDVVLAVVDNAATIKTFKKSSNTIILYPESDNPIHTPLYLKEDNNAFINGKVIAVLENPSSFKN
jgi:repressor LexA